MACLSSFVVSATLAATTLASAIPKALPWANLAISASPDDGYLYKTKTKEPFFWIADTNWELFHKLNRTDVDLYLADRAGFTVPRPWDSRKNYENIFHMRDEFRRLRHRLAEVWTLIGC